MSIESNYYTKFKDDFHALTGQKISRLESFVTTESVTNADEWVFNSIGHVQPQEILDRNSKIVFENIDTLRRGVAVRDFIVPVPVSSLDEARTMLDLKSGYAMRCAQAMKRKKDQIILEAALGNVLTGQKLGTSVTAAADGVATIAAGGVGLTYAKAVAIRESFEENDIALDEDEKIVLCITQKQHTDALNDDKFINSDFYSGREIGADGRITSLLGMQVKIFGTVPAIGSAMISKTGSDRNCIAFITGGENNAIAMASNSDIGIDVEKRTDLVKTWQVISDMSMSAVRTEGKLVKKFLCQE